MQTLFHSIHPTWKGNLRILTSETRRWTFYVLLMVNLCSNNFLMWWQISKTDFLWNISGKHIVFLDAFFTWINFFVAYIIVGILGIFCIGSPHVLYSHCISKVNVQGCLTGKVLMSSRSLLVCGWLHTLSSPWRVASISFFLVHWWLLSHFLPVWLASLADGMLRFKGQWQQEHLIQKGPL